MKRDWNDKEIRFEPIHRGPEEWPVVRLSKNRKRFIEEVIDESILRIKAQRPAPRMLREEIEITMHKERLRVKENPWKVDPEDEPKFWNDIKKRLIGIPVDQSDNENQIVEAILHDIISRYANEIAGKFKTSQYRLARGIVLFGFRRLLNAARIKKFGSLFRGDLTLQDKIDIKGEIHHLRKLAQLGTIVLVPTHFSNLDSILIGYVIHSMGLPAFIYGAGLNLFNISLFAYFMNSLGAYKVDRRKKNMIYLETLKTYSSLALQQGIHSLFFPGGTRSRSGMIETKLKLGLLGTAMEAQRINFEKSENGKAKKIFVFPMVLNYNFVLEAATLISDYLRSEGQERYYFESDGYSSSYKILSFLIKFFTKGSNISVSIGRGMDLLGNYVDDEGNSLDATGKHIDIRDYFSLHGKINKNTQRENEYTKMLSERIVKEFHAIARVLSSHLVAFTAFEMLRKRHTRLDIYNFLRLPVEELVILYEDFKITYEKVLKRILILEQRNKIQTADHIKGADIDKIIDLGLENVGILNAKRPLLKNKEGNIITMDLNLLYYYHNRLCGYDLEKYI